MTDITQRPIPGRDVPALNRAEPLPRPEPITQIPVLILFPHNRCNCRCLMCDIWRIREQQEIEPEAVARWTDEWRQLGVRRVVLTGGEALMHSRLWNLCAVLTQAGINITLLSSGLLLYRHAAPIVRYCDDLVVSLDGPETIHDRIRGVRRAYALLARGVAAVRMASASIRVTARCVVQRDNYRHLRDTVAAAHALGLDGISFLAVDVSSEAFNRPRGWPNERARAVALAQADLPGLAAELRAMETACKDDFESRFIAESPRKLWVRLYQYFSALLGCEEFYPNDCNAPWVSAVIESDGTVRPCFFHRSLGVVSETRTLREVLNAPEAIEWRRGLDTRQNPICRRCVLSLAVREVPNAVTGPGRP